MRRVQCGECGKRYDFDVDDFCPKCGAFNQPARDGRVTIRDGVVRIDGINEANHQNSFTHQELHAEDRERRRMGLDQPVGRRPKKGKTPVLVWVLLAIVGFNIFIGLVQGLMELFLLY